LEFVSRQTYRLKDSIQFQDELREKYGEYYLIPEGGTNELALKGCGEFAKEVLQQNAFDYLLLPVGTGGTMAGILTELNGDRSVIGVSVLKNGEFLNAVVSEQLKKYCGLSYGNWSILTSYDHGGYAKETKSLLDFVSAMKDRHNLLLDTVYTGKLMWAVLKEIEERRFPKGSTVLALHTGGLQGQYDQSISVRS
jgi:1-aminocyclopropane-1-carboxylate deaminase/D-cysteine desulfhydrase-like pyridoxal-dependent ACC family enzyme